MTHQTKPLKAWIEELIALEAANVGVVKWYERAQTMIQTLADDTGNPEEIPEEIWHFLSDADNRAEDPAYAKEQLAKIKKLMAINA